MNIRRATKSDVKKLVELDKEANKEVKWWGPLSSSEFFKLLRHKNFVYVAEENKEIIGYISATIENKQLVLENLYVEKEFRQKGIAKKLAKKFLSDWKNSKFKTMRLYCPERLRKFYEKLGFKLTVIVMKRRLK